jgi:hypothetical protein
VSSENYTLLSFTSDDNLVVSTAGLFDVLLCGAGGGGTSQGGGLLVEVAVLVAQATLHNLFAAGNYLS